MIMPNGTIVDTYYDFGVGGAVPDVVPGAAPERTQQTTGAIPSTINATGTVYAATSTDGGKTWSARESRSSTMPAGTRRACGAVCSQRTSTR